MLLQSSLQKITISLYIYIFPPYLGKVEMLKFLCVPFSFLLLAQCETELKTSFVMVIYGKTIRAAGLYAVKYIVHTLEGT